MNIRTLAVTLCLSFCIIPQSVYAAGGMWDYLFGDNSSYSYASDDVHVYSSSQMRNYVQQFCRAFGGSQLSYSEVNDLEAVIIRAINNDSLAYQSGRHSGYLKDKIDEYIYSGILQFIEEYAYSYVYRKVKNNSRARAIAESMRNNALALISQNKTGRPVPAAQLGQYIGSALKKAVDYELAQNQQSYSKPHHNNPPAYNPEYMNQQAANAANNAVHKPSFVTYPSDDCCICMESFDTVQRMFLKPCGHDICLTCAYSWFLDRGNKTCPQCRATVSIKDLEKAFAQ